RCDCSPIPCVPDASGLRCNPTPCPDPTEQCVPTRIRRLPTGGLQVLTRDCLPNGACHVDINAAGQVVCVWECAPRATSHTTTTTNSDGSVDFSCNCQPLPQCAPDPTGLRCNPTPCPNPNEQCVPTIVRRLPSGQFQVIRCDCLPVGSCHVDLDPVNGVTCVGQCPPGSTCDMTFTTNPDGSIDFSCRCDPLPCGPDPSGQRCNPVQCPAAGQPC